MKEREARVKHCHVLERAKDSERHDERVRDKRVRESERDKLIGDIANQGKTTVREPLRTGVRASG